MYLVVRCHDAELSYRSPGIFSNWTSFRFLADRYTKEEAEKHAIKGAYIELA